MKKNLLRRALDFLTRTPEAQLFPIAQGNPPTGPKKRKGPKERLAESGSQDKSSIYAAPGFIERLAAIYQEEALVAPWTLYRYHIGNMRRYFLLNEDQKTFHWFLGVTTANHLTVPKGEHLVDWMIGMGSKEAAEQYRDEKGEEGSFMHIEFAKYFRERKYDLGATEKCMDEFCKVRGIDRDMSEGIEKTQKAILAMHAFVIEYNLEPVGIELPVFSKKYGFATLLDLLCWMDVPELDEDGKKKKGKKKRVLAIIDWKSSLKGFYDGAAQQLGIGQLCFEESFPRFEKPNALFNWRPKDWIGANPTFHLKDQTKDRGAQRGAVIKQLEYALTRPGATPEPPRRMYISGGIEFGVKAETAVRWIDPVEMLGEVRQ